MADVLRDEWNASWSPDQIVFDVDGTLTEQSNAATAFVSQRAEELTYQVIKAGDSLYKSANTLKNKIMPEFHISPDIKAAILCRISHLRPDAKNGLRSIKESGVGLSIISDAPYEAWGRRIIKYFDLTGIFEKTCFCEGSTPRKPDPQRLLDIIEDKGGGVVWYVGDREKDMKLALNAQKHTNTKIIPVAMCKNSEAADFIRKSGCEGIIVNSIKELTDMARHSKGQNRFCTLES